MYNTKQKKKKYNHRCVSTFIYLDIIIYVFLMYRMTPKQVEKENNNKPKKLEFEMVGLIVFRICSILSCR